MVNRNIPGILNAKYSQSATAFLFFCSSTPRDHGQGARSPQRSYGDNWSSGGGRGQYTYLTIFRLKINILSLELSPMGALRNIKKISFDMFSFADNGEVTSCPAGHPPHRVRNNTRKEPYFTPISWSVKLFEIFKEQILNQVGRIFSRSSFCPVN